MEGKVRIAHNYRTRRESSPFSHQQSLAKHMNYHDKDQLAVEQFMKDYYIRASTVNTVNETLMKYFEEEIWEHSKNKKIIKLDTNFNIVNNLIELSFAFSISKLT